jgi:hypothetical protein
MAVVLLGFIAYGISTLYYSGNRSIDEQANRMLLDSRLRGKVEELVSKNFDQINSGSETMTVNGKDYTITWTANLVDLDDDTNPEPTAKELTVSVAGIPGRSITIIIADHQGLLGKI